MQQSLDSLIAAPENITPAQAEDLARRYPYFIYPGLIALKSESAPEKRAAIKQLIAAHIGDTDTLLNLFGPDGDVFADFYPDMHSPDPSTEDTINNFLDRFGSNLQGAPDPLDVAPAVDYAAILEAEEQGQSLPGASQGSSTPDQTDRAEEDPAAGSHTPDPPALTESLARLMIKNGNFSKALEIINDLNLNNPEKSVYFADQIRFLKKLILIKNNN